MPGRDLVCARCSPRPRRTRKAADMNRYAVPLGFTLAAVWVLVVFVLVSSAP